MAEHDEGDWTAFPAVAPDDEDAGEVTRLEVGGEVFELRPDRFGGTHYAWVSGPNAGYGFSTSPTPDCLEQHLVNIRSFLSMIDPDTGYIEDD
jgi:hypothetical protein